MTPDQPAYGRQVKVERHGREVRLVFVARTQRDAQALLADLAHQLRTGVLFIGLTGDPSKVRT